MIGIASYSAYIPITRLPLSLISGGTARSGGPEKSVSNLDEDSITMAVTAGTECIGTVSRESIDSLFFSSTTAPYREKQSSAVIASALNLRRDVLTADFTGSISAAAQALRAAFDSVSADLTKCILVIASDCRMATPYSPMEHNLGDAAVAFLITNDPVACFEGGYAINNTMYDVWRGEGDAYLNSWEERFIIKHGYEECLGEAIHGLTTRSGHHVSDYDQVALYAPSKNSHRLITKSIGFSKESVVEPLFGKVGNCGTAFAPLLLVSALETARLQGKSNQSILVGFYGDGAHALLFKTTEKLSSRLISKNLEWHLDKAQRLYSYKDYLAVKNITPGLGNTGKTGGISATEHYRDRDADIGFKGERCLQCGTEHFPATRVCYRCYTKDQFEPVNLSTRSGTLMSYSYDYFFPSAQSPVAAGMFEVEGGVRIYLQIVDSQDKSLRCGLSARFVFRKIHSSGGKPAYFWKAVITE